MASSSGSPTTTLPSPEIAEMTTPPPPASISPTTPATTSTPSPAETSLSAAAANMASPAAAVTAATATAIPMFEPGDIIFEDAAYVSVLNDEERGKRCDFCFRCPDRSLLAGPLGACAKCKFVHYCSKECQKGDWPAHKTECKRILSLPENLREKLANAMVRLMARIVDRDVRGDNVGVKSLVYKRCFDDLEPHVEELRQQPERMQRLGIIVEALKYFLRVPDPLVLVKYDDTFFSRVFGRIAVNSYGVTDELGSSDIGTAIYLDASRLDHSCKPNAVTSFHGTSAHIRALEQIPKAFLDLGPKKNLSRIRTTYSVVDLLQLASTKKRKEKLKKKYLFECDCQWCNEDDLSFLGRCPECEGLVQPGGESAFLPCEQCGYTLSSDEKTLVKQIVVESLIEHEKIARLMEKEEYKDCLDRCHALMLKQDQVFFHANRLSLKTIIKVFTCAYTVLPISLTEEDPVDIDRRLEHLIEMMANYGQLLTRTLKHPLLASLKTFFTEFYLATAASQQKMGLHSEAIDTLEDLLEAVCRGRGPRSSFATLVRAYMSECEAKRLATEGNRDGGLEIITDALKEMSKVFSRQHPQWKRMQELQYELEMPDLLTDNVGNDNEGNDGNDENHEDEDVSSLSNDGEVPPMMPKDLAKPPAAQSSVPLRQILEGIPSKLSEAEISSSDDLLDEKPATTHQRRKGKKSTTSKLMLPGGVGGGNGGSSSSNGGNNVIPRSPVHHNEECESITSEGSEVRMSLYEAEKNKLRNKKKKRKERKQSGDLLLLKADEKKEEVTPVPVPNETASSVDERVEKLLRQSRDDEGDDNTDKKAAATAAALTADRQPQWRAPIEPVVVVAVETAKPDSVAAPTMAAESAEKKETSSSKDDRNDIARRNDEESTKNVKKDDTSVVNKETTAADKIIPVKDPEESALKGTANKKMSPKSSSRSNNANAATPTATTTTTTTTAAKAKPQQQQQQQQQQKQQQQQQQQKQQQQQQQQQKQQPPPGPPKERPIVPIKPISAKPSQMSWARIVAKTAPTPAPSPSTAGPTPTTPISGSTPAASPQSNAAPPTPTSPTPTTPTSGSTPAASPQSNAAPPTPTSTQQQQQRADSTPPLVVPEKGLAGEGKSKREETELERKEEENKAKEEKKEQEQKEQEKNAGEPKTKPQQTAGKTPQRAKSKGRNKSTKAKMQQKDAAAAAATAAAAAASAASAAVSVDATTPSKTVAASSDVVVVLDSREKSNVEPRVEEEENRKTAASPAPKQTKEEMEARMAELLVRKSDDDEEDFDMSNKEKAGIAWRILQFCLASRFKGVKCHQDIHIVEPQGPAKSKSLQNIFVSKMAAAAGESTSTTANDDAEEKDEKNAEPELEEEEEKDEDEVQPAKRVEETVIGEDTTTAAGKETVATSEGIKKPEMAAGQKEDDIKQSPPQQPQQQQPRQKSQQQRKSTSSSKDQKSKSGSQSRSREPSLSQDANNASSSSFIKSAAKASNKKKPSKQQQQQQQSAAANKKSTGADDDDDNIDALIAEVMKMDAERAETPTPTPIEKGGNNKRRSSSRSSSKAKEIPSTTPIAATTTTTTTTTTTETPSSPASSSEAKEQRRDYTEVKTNYDNMFEEFETDIFISLEEMQKIGKQSHNMEERLNAIQNKSSDQSHRFRAVKESYKALGLDLENRLKRMVEKRKEETTTTSKKVVVHDDDEGVGETVLRRDEEPAARDTPTPTSTEKGGEYLAATSSSGDELQNALMSSLVGKSRPTNLDVEDAAVAADEVVVQNESEIEELNSPEDEENSLLAPEAELTDKGYTLTDDAVSDDLDVKMEINEAASTTAMSSSSWGDMLEQDDRVHEREDQRRHPQQLQRRDTDEFMEQPVVVMRQQQQHQQHQQQSGISEDSGLSDNRASDPYDPYKGKKKRKQRPRVKSMIET